ncbi:MAG: YncE family protein [Bacteroidia bacterium]|nr:YncE family protein [Bacteroidia bacterium]
MKRTLLFFAGMILMVCFVSLNARAQKSEYQVAKSIQLTSDGGWDYLSVDDVNQKLFVSHSSQVNVVDLKTGEQIAVIPETSGVHGIAIANDLNKAFISCGRDSSVTVVDLSTFKLIAKVTGTGKNPDAILYDPFSKKVFTFNGRSSNATVIDAVALKIIATIPLSGKPEFSQTDGKGKIYVNIEDKSLIAIINSVTLKVEKEWSIAPGEEPSGLALDNVNHRLFSVCGNKMMTISDAVAGKVITTVPIGGGCDGVAFDPATKRIFSSNGEGTMTVVQQVSADEYKVLENFPTQQGARTITVNKTTHHIYLPTAELLPGEGRRQSKPNTFKVLDIEPVK